MLRRELVLMSMSAEGTGHCRHLLQPRAFDCSHLRDNSVSLHPSSSDHSDAKDSIIISASVANKLDKFQNIGGYIGVSISSSFLLLVAIINSVILYRTIQARKRFLRDSQSFTEEQMATMQEEIASNTCLSRLAKPLFKMIDAPWKLYPLGCVFGLGFDTASSVLLLSLSAIASASLSDHPAELILLPLLFTAGMTAVDSLDGIIMVLAYCQGADALKAEGKGWKKLQFYREHKGEDAEDAQAQQMRTKMATFSSLSIVSLLQRRLNAG